MTARGDDVEDHDLGATTPRDGVAATPSGRMVRPEIVVTDTREPAIEIAWQTTDTEVSYLAAARV